MPHYIYSSLSNILLYTASISEKRIKIKETRHVSFATKAKALLIPNREDYTDIITTLYYNCIEINKINIDAYEELEAYRHSNECRQKKIELMIDRVSTLAPATHGESADYSMYFGFTGIQPVMTVQPAIDVFAEIGMKEASMLLYQP